MYTQKELIHTKEIIRRVAQAHKVSEAQVRADMMEALNAGKRNQKPAVQARWEAFRDAGTKPALEEYILWIVARLVNEKLNK